MIPNTTSIDLLQSQINTSSLKNLNTRTADEERLLQTCKEFESIFVKQMLNSMKGTIQKSGLLQESMAEGIFEDMLYDKYAEKIAKTGNLGIGEMMYRQLSASLDSTKPSEIR